MQSIEVGRVTGSIAVAIRLDGAARFLTALGGAEVSNIGCVEAGSRLRGALAVGPGTLPQEVTFVFGSEIASKWRIFLAVILEVCFYVHEQSENYDKGAHEHQDERDLGHNVLL